MGCFETFYAEVECPHCGEKDVMEFQTKELECAMGEFRVGDKVDLMNLTIKEGEIRNATADHYYYDSENKETGGCKGYMKATIVIEDGKYVGVKDVRAK